MSLLTKVLGWFQPPALDDPTFGRLLFMRMDRDPSLSYWEGEWEFPPRGRKVSIGLPGGEEGPREEGRAFHAALPERFDEIVRLARPRLDEVFRRWFDRPLHDDLWQDVELAGFGLEDPTANPIEWDVSFETTGDKWLGITVPFLGDEPGVATVDT